MSKILKQYQNNGKALEVRLEETSGKYIVILAGMTVQFRTGCAGGRCEGGNDNNYLFMDNETYMVNSFPTYQAAEEAYEMIRARYIDYHWLEKTPVLEACAK